MARAFFLLLLTVARALATTGDEWFSEDKRFKAVETELLRSSEKQCALYTVTTADDLQTLWTCVVTNREGAIYFGSPLVSRNGDFLLLLGAAGKVIVRARDFAKEIDLAEEDGRLPNIVLDQSAFESRLRIWNPATDIWSAWSLPGGERVSVTPPMIDRWNRETREKILNKLRAESRARLAKKLRDWTPRLEGVAAMFDPTMRTDLEQIDWEFLLRRRIPGDRSLLLKRLANDPDSAERYYFPAHGGHDFNVQDYARLRADYVLAVWDGKTNHAFGVAIPDWGAPFHLGAASGIVRFPTPLLSNPGYVRVYLIPKGAERGDWTQHTETETLVGSLPSPSAGETDLVDEASFRFGSVTPGHYFVKAIWDKRPPWDDVDKAGPGDYESALFGPITIRAGQSISNLVLQCTNRATGGEAWYRADAMALQLWKAGELWPGQFDPNNSGMVETFSRRPDQWITQINLLAADARKIARIALIRQTEPDSNRSTNSPPALVALLQPNLEIPAEGDERLVRFVLVDEHGCRFEADDGLKRMDADRVSFSAFPRAARQFRLLASRVEEPFEILMDCTLTNLVLVDVPPVTAETLPLVRGLSGAEMKIVGMSYAPTHWGADSKGLSLLPDLEVDFGEAGWQINDIQLTDVFGVKTALDAICQRDPAVNVSVTVSRDAEHAPQRWSFSINDLPAAGEFRTLKVKTNLCGKKLEAIAILGAGTVKLPGRLVYAREGSAHSESCDATVSLDRMECVSTVPHLLLDCPNELPDTLVYVDAPGFSTELGSAVNSADIAVLPHYTGRLVFISLRETNILSQKITISADVKQRVEFCVARSAILERPPETPPLSNLLHEQAQTIMGNTALPVGVFSSP